MAEESLLFGDRVWFHDARTPVRRMAVSTHADHGLVILSTWLGDTCTGTFRLPLRDAAGLIAALADGMATGLPTTAGTQLSRGSPRGLWQRWWLAVRGWFAIGRGAPAPVTLRRVK